MKLNNIWGYGQLFGYSAFDGPNRYYEDNILTLTKKKLCFRFEYFPNYLLMSFNGFKNIKFEAIMSDFIIAKTDNKEFKLTFIDNDTLIAKSSKLPTFKNEVNAKEYQYKSLKIIELDNRYIGVKYIKKNDQYIIVIHHALSLKDIKKFEEYKIKNININSLIKDKLVFYKNTPKCLDKKYENLFYKALSIIKVNTHSKEGNIDDFWTTPDRVPHRHMWMWDSAFHAMAISLFSKVHAKKALFSMIKQIKENGMMPHMVTTKDSSNVTQPPVMAYAVYYLYKKDKDKAFVKKCLPYLDKYLTFDLNNRDKNKNGLLEWTTNPGLKTNKCDESGLDNSPRFDFEDDMDCIDFSTYFANDAYYLSKLYSVINNEKLAAKWMKIHKQTKEKINELLWDEKDGTYYDRLFSNKLTKVLTHSSFLPLFANISSKEQARKMVKTLTNKKLLWSINPIASISQQDKRFCNDMWRGGVWINLNYFIIKGLSNYGYKDLADTLRNKTLSFINKWYKESGCIYEYYDPLNKINPTLCLRKDKIAKNPDFRKGMHAIVDFNWSACFTLLLIQKEY